VADRFTARRGLQQWPPASFLTRVMGGACLALLVTGISSDTRAAQAVTIPIAVVRIVDEAIRALGDPSSNYQKVVADAVAALPGNEEASARAALRRVLERMPEPGADFRCSADFVRARARKALLRIRDTLLNQYTDRVEPAVCYAAPYAIDSSRLDTGDRQLHIYGYDFDTAAVEIDVVTRDGYRDVTPALAAISHYHLVLNLSSVTPSASDLSIGVVWGHLIRYSVALIRPTTPLCATHIETIPAGKTISDTPAGVPGVGLARRSGARVWADASLDYENNKVDATICMTADWGRDGATLSGCTVNFVHTTDPDSLIEGIVGPVRSHIFQTQPTARTATPGSRAGPVRQWRFSGFGSGGSEAPSVTAELTAFRVVSTAGNGCLSPQAYLEARRTSAVSGATQRALDPQLRHVDTVILNFRPSRSSAIRARKRSRGMRRFSCRNQQKITLKP
jgi:hypothetical protein